MKTLFATVAIALANTIPALAYAQLAQVQKAPAAATSAGAHSADRPLIVVGDTWQYAFSDSRSSQTDCTYSLTVTSVTADNMTVDMRNPQHCNLGALAASIVYDKDFNLIYPGATAYRTSAFPLTVGKQWNQKFGFKTEANTPLYNDVTAKVIALEKVTVPAGIFDAYKIVIERKYQSQYVSGTITETRWYAPQAKNYVRRTSVDSAGGSSSVASELLAYRQTR